MSKYDINVKRLALLILPTFWRKSVFAALSYAVVSPLQRLHTQFSQWKVDTLYRVEKNGQVCHLRAVLNDLFDPIDRRITITDNVENVGHITFYHRNADKGVRLPMRGSGRAVILNRRGYGGINGYDFWVNIPIALYGKVDLNQVTGVVNTYKLASKRFSINFI